jgi:nucleotide-binding universal stress UspA family protein
MNAIPVRDHVAVGVDGSPASHAALRWAACEATMRGVPLHILYGTSGHGIAWPQHVGPHRRPRRNAEGDLRAEPDYLVAIATEAARRLAPSVTVSGTALHEAAGPMLVAESARAALLVVGSRGTGGYAGLLLGSISAYAATRAQCPVVVVPPTARSRQTGPIVVGVDGSEIANLAVRFAFEEAALRHVSLMAIRAVTPTAFAGSTVDSKMADLRHLERMRLAQALSRWVSTFPDVRFDGQVVSGDAVTALTRAADDAQLLVVGSRGLGGFGGMLVGSVSLRLLHHPGCAVAVVHPHHHDAGHLRHRRMAAAAGGVNARTVR